MADDGTKIVAGQPGGEPSGTTPKDPTSTTGQPSATATTTDPQGTTAASGEDTFFDPKDLDPALIPAYKNMQKAFSKKMEGIKEHRQKIDAYDQFSKDPLGQIQAMASRMGYKLTRAEAKAVADSDTGGDGEFQPQTWGEVFNKATEVLMEKISPILSEIQTMKKNSMEKLLDENAPDWREHEDEMIALLREHPTLAKDPVKLYRLALPTEVLETRATQAALKKLQDKTNSSKIGGTSTTKQTTQTIPEKMSFNEAVAYAKQKLAEQGIKGPT